MKYKDLRDFIAQLETQGELKRINVEIDPRLEMTEICDRVLKAGGPAILFEKPRGHHSRAGQPVRHTPSGSDGHGAGLSRGAARSRQAPRLPERTRSAQGFERRLGKTSRVETGAQHGAEGAIARPLPGNRLGRQGRGSRQAADPDLLAGGCGAADHLGA